MNIKANIIPDIMCTPFEIVSLIITVEEVLIEIWEQEKIEDFRSIIEKRLKSQYQRWVGAKEYKTIFIKFDIN